MESTLNWSQNDVITFPQGIIGFEGAREFVIYSLPEHEPFHWMACVNGPSLQFVLINPLLVRSEYDPVIPPMELKQLDVRDPQELLLYTIVTVAEEMADSTANLAGPLFVNIRTRIGRQIPVDDPRWGTSVRILG
ncbi:MAG: flagellar assembly protein FliW [Fibrobacteria bacterium]|nr:flagellar assembly protein FliW [Fibrobacteria bacterium]